jgi:hypothetical protein
VITKKYGSFLIAKSMNSVCLQPEVMCVCNYFVCVIAKTAGYFISAKKPEQCVLATILCV